MQARARAGGVVIPVNLRAQGDAVSQLRENSSPSALLGKFFMRTETAHGYLGDQTENSALSQNTFIT